jgi:predicted MFS family arabinose efflux permease
MPLLWLLALAGFSAALPVRLLDPLVPALAREFAVEPDRIALLATAFALPYAIGQPVLGPLGDALGKARVIKWCLGLMACALAMTALAPSFELLVAARIATGLAGAGIIPLVFAIVGDRFTVAERQVVLSRVLGAILTGGLLGAAISGIIGASLGWRVVALIVASVALACWLATLKGLKPRPDRRATAFTLSGLTTGYARVFENPLSYVCYAAVMAEGVVIFGTLPYLALILEERGGGSIREAGFVIASFGLGGIVFTALVSHLLRLARGQLNMIRLGGLVTGLALAGLAYAESWQAAAAAYVVVGIGFYMIHNSLQVRATELAPEARGAAVSLHAFWFFLGQATGPVAFGLARDGLGTTPAVALTGALILAIGLLTASGLALGGRRRT